MQRFPREGASSSHREPRSPSKLGELFTHPFHSIVAVERRRERRLHRFPLTRVEPNQQNMKTRTGAGTADAGARSSKQRTMVAIMEDDMSATGLDVFAKT